MRMGITFFVSGCLLLLFAAAMLFPAGLDWIDGTVNSAKAFGMSALLTGFAGLLLLLTFYNKYEKLTVREMYLTTSLVWLIVCAFCALPFYFSPVPMNYTDSFFESMSGLTTMGASVIRDLDHAPRGILLWRAVLQWIGGLGIIVIALGILPLLRIGGMQLFSMESSDKSGKQMPKTQQVIATMMLIYVTLTAMCLLCLIMTGMTPFNALAFTLCTIPTGGFAPTNASAADLRASAQWIIFFFMFVSGLPLLLPYSVLKKDWEQIRNDIQIKTYTLFVLISGAVMTLWLMLTGRGVNVFDAARHSLFNIVSVMTSTGFTTDNLENWGAFPLIFFTFLLSVGACSGSTSGGIKVFRFNIIYLFSLQYLRHKILPHGVFIAKYNGRPLTEEIAAGVFVFFAIFLCSFLITVLTMGMMGMDFMTSVSGALSALGNTGVAFGKVIGADGSFANLPVKAKWLMSADMMLGRLEFSTVFVVLLPLAWRTEKNSVSEAAF